MPPRFHLRCSKPPPGTPSTIALPNLCIGTWSWGSARVWNNDTPTARAALDTAWDAMVTNGLTFIDTAEIYGSGKSETYIGELRNRHRDGRSPSDYVDKRDGDAVGEESELVIASKFIPIPWPPSRLFMPSAVVNACRASLSRMGLESMALYQIHGPVHFLNSIDAVAGGLAACVDLGLARAVGVSNYSREEMVQMDEALKRRGHRLASNQVEFSLLRTLPERSGLLGECRERGILMMAYSPLGMGRLTGKYTPENPPPSGRRFSNYPMQELSPLLAALHRVAKTHDVKPSAVALKWVIQKGALPLGGVKIAEQVEENAKAASDEWSIAEEDMAELEKHSIVGTTSWAWQHG